MSETITTKKIVYETQWIARDSEKKYEHGWGFTPVLVEFPQDADPAWCAQMCMINLSNEEFECIGATPRKLINGCAIALNYPKNKEEYEAWKFSGPKSY